MAFTTNNDLNILQSSDVATMGAGLGDDVYLINASSMSATQKIIITDVSGANTIKILGGVVIASNLASANEVLLTLESGAIIDILGADTFSFEIGGDPFATGTGSSQTFSQFLISSLGMAEVPTGTNTAAGNANITIDTSGTAIEEGAAEFSIAAASVLEGNTGTTSLITTVTRSGDTTSTASVNISTTANTATAGIDYTEVTNQTINFAIGESTANFTISVSADTEVESDETLTATLSLPSTGLIKSGAGSASLTITNDDTTTATFTLNRGIDDIVLLGINSMVNTSEDFSL